MPTTFVDRETYMRTTCPLESFIPEGHQITQCATEIQPEGLTIFHEPKEPNVDETVAFLNFKRARGVPVATLQVQRLTEHAQLPTYGSAGAAGLDLYADLSLHTGSEICRYIDPDSSWNNELTGGGDSTPVADRVLLLHPGTRKLIHTGISVAIPRGNYGRVAPRSGLAFKNGIDVLAGVVDEDYRGEIGVILINQGAEPLQIAHGDRVAQLVIEKITPCHVVEVPSLDASDRGSGAYGSTGK